MREAIEEYVEREEKRAQFRQDALAAWAAYQATGLHASAAEACRALVKLALEGGGRDNVTVIVAGYKIPRES